MTSRRPPLCRCGIAIVVGLSFGSPIIADTAEAGEDIYYLAHGHIFTVHPQERAVTTLYSVDPSAPVVDCSADGECWAKVGDKLMGAVDARSGKLLATVEVPWRPYNHVIAANGKAYVTHHTVVDGAFTLSIIDTHTKAYGRCVEGIRGLRTDLVSIDSNVYLVTTGIGQDDTLYLYELDTRQDGCTLVYREPRRSDCWRLSCTEESVLICRFGIGSQDVCPGVSIMDRATRRIRHRIGDIPEVACLRDKISFAGRGAYAPGTTHDGEPALVVFESQSLAVRKVLLLEGDIFRIAGIRGRTLVYVDNLARKGARGVSMYFFDFDKERDVGSVNLVEVLKDRSDTAKTDMEGGL